MADHGRTAKTMLAMALAALLVAASAAAGGAACVTDDTDTEVCVAAPERVVSLYGAFTEVLWEVGAGERLVARTKNDTTVPAVAALPSVGTGLRPNVEYLLALRPDLVVSRSSRAAAEALTALRARGLTVAAFDPRSLEDLFATVRRLGTLTGTRAPADALAAKLSERLDAVRAVTAGVPESERPRVVFEVRADPLTVAGQAGLVSELIAAAGGVNPVTARKKLLRLDVEALLRLDPDAYLVQRGAMNRNPRPPAERPHLAALGCVRAGRVLVVDETLFSRPGPRVAEAAEQLSRFLHPQLWDGR